MKRKEEMEKEGSARFRRESGKSGKRESGGEGRGRRREGEVKGGGGKGREK